MAYFDIQNFPTVLFVSLMLFSKCLKNSEAIIAADYIPNFNTLEFIKLFQIMGVIYFHSQNICGISAW